MSPCVHRWKYYHNATGTCSYKVCLLCGQVVWFAKECK